MLNENRKANNRNVKSSALTAVIAVLLVGPPIVVNDASGLSQQDAKCGDLPEAGWVDRQAARELSEIAQQMKNAAGVARSSYYAAVQRRYGSADIGVFSGYYRSALDVAGDAVRFDPTDPQHVLLFADLHFELADLGDGDIDVERARQSLGHAECAVQLAVAAGNIEVERRARSLVRGIRIAIEVIEPG